MFRCAGEENDEKRWKVEKNDVDDEEEEKWKSYAYVRQSLHFYDEKCLRLVDMKKNSNSSREVIYGDHESISDSVFFLHLTIKWCTRACSTIQQSFIERS
jgi:hypothetical protein